VNEVKDWKLALIFEIVHKEGRILFNIASPRECFPLSAMKDSQLPADARAHLQRYIVTYIKEHYVRLIFESMGGQLWPVIPTTHTPVDPGCPCPKRPRHVEGCPGHGCHCPLTRVHVPGCPGARIPKLPHCGPTHVPRAGEPWPPTKLPLPQGPQIYPGATGPVTIEWTLLWELFIKETSLHGHHSITTVSQAGLNAQFVTLWKSAKELAQKQIKPEEKPDVRAVLADFSSEHYPGLGADVYIPHICAQLGAPQVELVCSPNSKSAIIYFHIERGSIKTSEPQYVQDPSVPSMVDNVFTGNSSSVTGSLPSRLSSSSYNQKMQQVHSKRARVSLTSASSSSTSARFSTSPIAPISQDLSTSAIPRHSEIVLMLSSRILLADISRRLLMPFTIPFIHSPFTTINTSPPTRRKIILYMRLRMWHFQSYLFIFLPSVTPHSRVYLVQHATSSNGI